MKLSEKSWKYKDWLLVLSVLVAVGVIKASIIDVNRIVSGSMLPTLKSNDMVLSYKFQYGIRIPQTNYYLYRTSTPSVGDVVLFEGDKPSFLTTWIKRVIAKGGDKVSLINKKLYVNGIEKPCSSKIKNESSYSCNEVLNGTSFQVQWLHNTFPKSDDLSEIIVPKNYVFLMGDNRNNSLDSRYIGTIHIDKIYGKQLYSFSW